MTFKFKRALILVKMGLQKQFPTSCHNPHSRSSGASLFRRSARLYTARSGAVNRGRVTQEARLTGGFGEVEMDLYLNGIEDILLSAFL